MIKSADIFTTTNEIEKIFIHRIWQLSDDDTHSRREIILPKGTVEIIFNFSDRIYYSKDTTIQSQITLPAVFINGINFKPFELIKTGRQEFLGIQLNGIGLRLLFNISAKELNNTVCNGNELCTQLEDLACLLFHKNTFHDRIQIILSWIREKVNLNNLHYSLERIRKLIGHNCCNGQSIKKLSQEICLSDRQLRRFTQNWLGMNTEEFIQYNKYLKCLHLLHNPAQSLTDIGLEAGYFDQSHFIREFKSYTDMTPRNYREANAEFPGHILLDS